VHLSPGSEFQNLKFEKLGFPHKTLVAVAVAVSEPVAVAVAVPVAVAAVQPVAITLEVFGNDYCCYQMEPLPANAIRGMYSHMVNG
jgi:hypothetical protein